MFREASLNHTLVVIVSVFDFRSDWARAKVFSRQASVAKPASAPTTNTKVIGALPTYARSRWAALLDTVGAAPATVLDGVTSPFAVAAPPSRVLATAQTLCRP